MADSRLTTFFPFLLWWRLLDRPTLRADIVAGITAGVLILPQAVALAALAGLPPEYGIYTAVFPVIIAALFGSSFHVMSGPNTALAVLIFLDLSTFASRGTEQYIQYAMGLTFMAGVFQVFFGLARLGAVFNYISPSVIVGLTAGVGLVIIIQQLGNFFGILMNQREEIYETVLQVYYNFDHVNWAAAACGLVTILSGLIVRRINRKLPHLIIAIVVGTAFAWLLDLFYGSATLRIDKLGVLTLSAFPFRLVDFSDDSLIVYGDLILSAILIGFLGLMQSAVIARSLAAKSGQTINMNQEIVSQGLSNVVGSYLSCFASCGSFNRSAANYDAGGKTPLASLVSAFALGILIWFAADLIALMPISVMAGLLMLVGWGLIDHKEIGQLINSRSELLIFAACFFMSVVFGLDYGVITGVFLSVTTYLGHVSRPVFRRITGDAAQSYLPPQLRDKQVTVKRLTGNLFFGSVQSIDLQLRNLAQEEGRDHGLFLSLEYVGHLDTAGAQSLAKEATRRQQAGGSFCLGLRDHAFDEVLEKSGALAAIGAHCVFYWLPTGEAIPRDIKLKDPTYDTTS
ncbi:MAG: SulP family inorganic anion transporter [Thiobacillus sp.]